MSTNIAKTRASKHHQNTDNTVVEQNAEIEGDNNSVVCGCEKTCSKQSHQNEINTEHILGKKMRKLIG